MISEVEDNKGAKPGNPKLADQEPANLRARRLAYFRLLVGMFSTGMGQTIIYVVLPPIAREIGLLDFQVGVVFMGSAFFWVLMGSYWGRLSDIYGRRRFILLGIIALSVSTLLLTTFLALSRAGVVSALLGFILIVGARCIYGAFGSAQPPASYAYVADRTSKEERAKGLATIGAAYGMGAMFGPALAGMMSGFDPLTPLYTVSALGAVTFFILYFFLTETSRPKDKQIPDKVSLLDPRVKYILLYAFISGIITLMPNQVIAFYFIDVFNLSDADALTKVSIALTAASFAMLFSQLVLVGRLGLSPRTLMRVGPPLLVLAYLPIALGASFPLIVTGLFLSGLGWGMMGPGIAAAVSLAVSDDEQGAVSGLVNAAIGSGLIIAPPIGFALYAIGPYVPFYFLTVLSCGLAIVTLWALKSGLAKTRAEL